MAFHPMRPAGRGRGDFVGGAGRGGRGALGGRGLAVGVGGAAGAARGAAEGIAGVARGAAEGIAGVARGAAGGVPGAAGRFAAGAAGAAGGFAAGAARAAGGFDAGAAGGFAAGAARAAGGFDAGAAGAAGGFAAGAARAAGGFDAGVAGARHIARAVHGVAARVPGKIRDDATHWKDGNPNRIVHEISVMNKKVKLSSQFATVSMKNGQLLELYEDLKDVKNLLKGALDFGLKDEAQNCADIHADILTQVQMIRAEIHQLQGFAVPMPKRLGKLPKF